MDRLANSGQFSIKRDVLFIDGIPRSRAQAEVLADKVDMLLLLHLRADQEPMLERIHKRALQENRLDDANPDVVRRRFQEYEAETAPILDFYPAAKIRTVDAGAAPLEVLRQIIEVLQIMLFPEACSTPPEQLTEPAYAAPCCASTTATAVSCTICSTVEFDGIRCTGRSNPIRMGPTASAPARHCVSL